MSVNKASVMSLSNLIDTKVKNFDGQYLGDVIDIIINAKHGKIVYVVFAPTRSCFMLSKQLKIVPYDYFFLEHHTKKLILSMNKCDINKLPAMSHKYKYQQNISADQVKMLCEKNGIKPLTHPSKKFSKTISRTPLL